MAINFIKKEDLSHITRTTRQWETTIDRYEIIPKGVLCIELCNDKLTKIKIGNGHLIYEQLPYVSDVNLSDYYTKEETNNLIKDLKAIKIKGEASSLSDLPLHGNEEGDLWFVKKQDPDTHSRYDEYIWYKNKWESFGSSDIDLSEYAKKSYVDTHIQEVQNEITEIIESGYLHKHDNKNILDHTSAVYNVEKDNKLRDLHNYDDTELREKAHTHLNKNILDQTDAVYNRDKDDKLSSLHNYDDTDVKDRISTLEGVAHSHSNQDVLDRTTAAFTKEQALTLLDCKDFEGTDGVHGGRHGFVPAPTAADAGKVLGANGQWVEGGSSGGDTITQGGGIEITTDSQTGVKTVSVNAGAGLSIDPDTGELNADAQALEPATTTTLGGVIIGDGISVDNDGVIDVNTGDGLSVNNDNELEVSVGDGLQIDANGAVEVNVGDGLSINASDEVELDKATTTDIGGVIVGDNIDVNNGTISVPKAASNKLGVVKPTDGLSIDSNGVLTVDTGDGLSIDSTTKEVNVNVGDGLQINQDNELEVNVGVGLSVDSTNNDINVNTGRALSVNNDNEIDVNIASRSAYGVVKVGEGINVDSNGIISVEAAPPFRTGDGIILTDESERLPSGFTKIEYVESSSTNVAYTSINYYVNANSKFIGRMSKTEPTTDSYGNSPGTVFGTIGYTRYMFGFVNDQGSSSPLYCGIQCGDGTSPDPWYNNKSSLITAFVLNDIVNFEASVAEGLKLNNELHQTYQVYGGTLPVGRKLGVMAADANGISSLSAFYGRLYFLKIYEGNVLKVSLVPCIQTSSSTPGLYDTVAGTFYASTSGNPFLYDPETIDVEVPDWVLKADIATSSKLGSVKVGSGLSATNDGTLSVNTGDGLVIDTNNNLKAKIGVGLHFNENNAIEADEIEIDTYEPGNGISFIRHYARELPVGYTQLEYIESRFDAGFILDYYPQKTSRIVCEAAYVDFNRSSPSDNCLFGSRNGNGSGSKQFVFWFNNKTSDPCYVGFVYSGNTWGDIGEHYTYANMHQRLLFEISPSIGVYCNNVQIQNPLSHPTYDPSPYKLGILCLATSNTGIDTTRNYQSGRIFTFKIYESDTLVVDLVPCLNDSDVPGLYDMVNEVFYSSASGTDFSYDPDAVVTHDSITIDANRGPGIIYENNALSLNPGAGLSIDETDNQKLNVNLADGLSIKNTSTNAIKINTGDGLSIDSTTNKLDVNIGDGLVKDSSNNIDINNNTDFYINTYNQLCINPLYAPTYEAGNGVQFVSTSPYNLPPNYTKLSCVESKNSSSDKSAFRLNYVPTTETKFDVLFGITKAGFTDVTIIGSGGSNTAKYSLNITRSSSAATNNTTVRFNYCQDNSSTSTSFTTAIGDILHIVADKNGVYVNNNLVQTPVQTGSPSSYKLCVGSSPATNNATSFRDPSTPGKYYDIKIYEGSTLTVHLIPCLNDSNVPGMYDEVNELFHHNEWKTDFHYDENEKTRPGYYVQAKLGNGLQFDANNAIEVINGGTEYTAGDGIDIDANDEISVKIGNHLSFDQTTGDINVDDIIEYHGGAATEVVNAAEFTIDKIRWNVSAIRSNSGSEIWIQLRYFGFYDDTYNRFPVSSGVSTWSDGSTVEYYQNRTIESLIANTERLCAKTWNGVRTFTMTFNLTYDISSDNLKYFRYYTGNDESGRDPVSWTIEVHDKVADTWIQVQSVTGATVPTGRNQWTSYFDLNLPPSDGKKINVLVGDGLFIDSTNNDVNVKIGQALSINNSNEIDVNLGRALSINNNNEIDVDIATATSLGVVKAGSGLNIDEFGNLSTQATPFRIGRALSLDDESVRLPSAYYKAKYVQSDGDARCYTGFYPGNYPNAKYVGTASVIGDTNGYKYIFGTQGDNYHSYWSMILSTSYDNQSIITGLTYNNNNDKVNDPITTAFAKGDMINFEASITSGLKLNNELVQSLSTTFTKSTDEMFIFGERAGYTTKARLYSFKIYNSDDTLLANFVPAVRKSDNEVGFYETVSNQFINSNYYGPPFTTDMDDLDVDDPDWVLNASIATSNSLGVVKPGTGMTVDEHGALNVTAYELPIAGPAVLGGIKIGDGIDINSNGVASVNKMDPFRVGRGLTMEDESERLPTGYYKAKYIESDGSAYTTIPFTPASYPNAKVIGKAMVTGAKPQYGQGYLFGTNKTNNWTGHFNFVLSTKTTSADSAIVTRFYYGDMYGPTDNPPFETGYSIGDILEFEMSASDGLKIDNETIHSISSSMSGMSTPYSFAIFGVGSASGTDYMSTARIYSLKIYNGDTLLVNLVPAYRQSDEKVGFYNTVNSTFYASSNNDHPFTTDLTDLDPGDPDWVLKANIATASSIGEVIVGDGLSVESDGTVSVNTGDGLTVNNDNELEVNTGDGLSINQDNELEVVPATASTLGGVIVGNGLTVTSDGTISTVTGKAYIAGEGINMSSSPYEFSAENEQYLFKSQVTCELHGDFNREFQKYTDDTALGMVWNEYNSGTLWSGPLFVGLSSDAVKYTANSTTYSALGTFSYLGKTWYYSNTQMYVSNIDGTDYDGNMVVDTETYASTSDIVQACKSLIDRARVILKVDEISLLPATEDTLGGIKIGEGLSIDENNVVSSTVYEEGQGITFETSGSTDSFDVKNKQYYFDYQVNCQLNGNFGPRTYTRVSTNEPCIAAIIQTRDENNPNTIWTNPTFIGLTETACQFTNSYDQRTIGPNTSFSYKGYTWYVTSDYGLLNSTGVDLNGHLVGPLDFKTYALANSMVEVSKAIIDLADVLSPGIKTYDVWNTGTGWLNGAYGDGTSDTFYTNWYKEYHSNNTEYFELPKGATEVKLTGISTSDTVFGGNDIDLFNDAKHHIGTFVGESQWHELLTGTVYLQFGVKWNEQNTQDISGSSVKSVTLEIKVPKNNAITAKLGDGLTFDENDAITLDESIKLIIHCVGTPLT